MPPSPDLLENASKEGVSRTPGQSLKEGQEDQGGVKELRGTLPSRFRVLLAFLLALPRAPWDSLKGPTLKERKICERVILKAVLRIPRVWPFYVSQVMNDIAVVKLMDLRKQPLVSRAGAQHRNLQV